MKKLTILILVFAVGCTIGAAVQHLRAGYWYKVHESESFPFPGGEVTLSHATESVGMPWFFDTGISVISVATKYRWPIAVYKAKRIFQESCPLARDVKVDGNQITWRDGINTYHLTVDPIEVTDPTPPNDVPYAAPEG
jgi:hypothetical protein